MLLDRYHGLGNDYLVLVQGPPLQPDLVRALCDRHQGAGSDGILESADPAGRDEGLTIWNPDGSVAEKSGNGLRIYARWLVDVGRRGAAPFSIWTGSCEVRAEVGPRDVVVQMGQASFEPADVPVVGDRPLLDAPMSRDGTTLHVCAVGLGNPHAVVFVEDPLDELPWRRWGELLETHPRFPHRTNVQVARVLAPDLLEARIHERGAGPTMASGSSACAVAAAAVRTSRVPPGSLTVRMPGGEVGVVVTSDYSMTLRGPVERIARLEIDESWSRSRGA